MTVFKCPAAEKSVHNRKKM